MLSYKILQRNATKLYFIETISKDYADIPCIYWIPVLTGKKIAYFKTVSEAEKHIAKLKSKEVDETCTFIKTID